MKAETDFDRWVRDQNPEYLEGFGLLKYLVQRFEVLERRMESMEKSLTDIEAHLRPIDTTSFTSYIRS